MINDTAFTYGLWSYVYSENQGSLRLGSKTVPIIKLFSYYHVTVSNARDMHTCEYQCISQHFILHNIYTYQVRHYNTLVMHIIHEYLHAVIYGDIQGTQFPIFTCTYNLCKYMKLMFAFVNS